MNCSHARSHSKNYRDGSDDINHCKENRGNGKDIFKCNVHAVRKYISFRKCSTAMFEKKISLSLIPVQPTVRDQSEWVAGMRCNDRLLSGHCHCNDGTMTTA